MSIPPILERFKFNHSDQADNYGQVLGDSLKLKQNFDSRAEELRVRYNALIDYLEEGGETQKKLATITIGTSQAGYSEETVDFLCDGIDDQEEIQEAINQSYYGGQILIFEGEYNITAPIVIHNYALVISGSGTGTRIVREFGDDNYQNGIFSIEGSFLCEIRDMTLDGNGYDEEQNSCIFLYMSMANKIKGVMTGESPIGISIANGAMNKVENSIIVNGVLGVYLDQEAQADVSGCIFMQLETGIWAYASGNNSFGGNIFSSVEAEAIKIEDSLGNNTIDGNVCSECGVGIVISGSSGDNLSGNACNGNTVGISLQNVEDINVTGNACVGNAGGLVVNGMTRGTIGGNACNNNDIGIMLDNVTNSNVSGNTATRGTGVAGNYTGSQHTIQVSNSDYNLIGMNSILGKDVTIDSVANNTLVYNKYQ